MSFYSRSAIAFGQLVNRLTACLANGSPFASALSIVRDHFEADRVELVVTHRGRDPIVYADDGPRQDPALAGERTIEVSDMGAAAATDYVLRILRNGTAPTFDAEDTALAGVVLSQIARTLDLTARIDTGAVERALYCDALDKLNVGVIVVDASGKVISSSAVAERFLRDRSGLQVQAGKLRATNTTEDRDLQAAIRSASQRRADGGTGPSKGLALTKASGTRTLGVMIRPAAAGAPAANSTVAIYLRDCDAVPEVEGEFVRQIFDLTPAEAAVTRRLTAGLSLEDAAHSLDISRNTARAHLRSIFSKSGITRQTELVRLVLSSAVVLGESPVRAA